MNNNQLIEELKKILDLYGICPHCSEAFKIKDTVEDEKYDWKVARVTDKGIITLENK